MKNAIIFTCSCKTDAYLINRELNLFGNVTFKIDTFHSKKSANNIREVHDHCSEGYKMDSMRSKLRGTIMIQMTIQMTDDHKQAF